MPKQRNAENRGLPSRWRLVHGAYYYRVPDGLEALWEGKRQFRLGSTLPEAYKVWAERLVTLDAARTVGDLLDRYALEVIPTKAPKTQSDYAKQVKTLRSVFGSIPIDGIKPQHVYQYFDKRSAKVAARREIEVLSHAFTKAVQWGYVDRHPFSHQVRLPGETPRTRYVEDWEIVECLSLPRMRKKGSVLAVQAYIKIKLLTGMRRGDLLRLRMGDLKDDGIHLTPHKTKDSTGKRVIYEWTPELRAAVDEATSVRPVDIAPTLFATFEGKCYINEEKGTAKGWDKTWANFMKRVLNETKVTERFTEHDLRAKCGSDAKTLQHAQQLLTHADSRMTERVYRRKPERVMPLR